MPEAILKFNLPEEQPEFTDAINASSWKAVVWDMKQELRKYWKHSNDEGEIQLATKLNEYLNGLLNENNVSLD